MSTALVFLLLILQTLHRTVTRRDRVKPGQTEGDGETQRRREKSVVFPWSERERGRERATWKEAERGRGRGEGSEGGRLGELRREGGAGRGGG